MTTPSHDAVSTPFPAPYQPVVSVITTMLPDGGIAWIVELHTDERRITCYDHSQPRALLLAGLLVRTLAAEAAAHAVAVCLATDDEWTSDTTDRIYTALNRAGFVGSCPNCGFATSQLRIHHCH